MRRSKPTRKPEVVGEVSRIVHFTNLHQAKAIAKAPLMQQFDLVLKNAFVNGAFNADIGIKNGLITALGLGLTLTDDTQVVDCKGAVVTPGGIDGHVHLAQDQSPRAKQAGYRCADNSVY
jgi:imidazolonepropionase-like amidohydrolase